MTSRARATRVCSPPESREGDSPCREVGNPRPRSADATRSSMVYPSSASKRWRAAAYSGVATLPAASASCNALAILVISSAPLRTASVSVAAPRSLGSWDDSCASTSMLTPRARSTRPRSGSSRPIIMRSNVVFPAPFGPTSPILSPAATLTLTFSRMVTAPISRPTSLSERMLIAHRQNGLPDVAPPRAPLRSPQGSPL